MSYFTEEDIEQYKLLLKNLKKKNNKLHESITIKIKKESSDAGFTKLHLSHLEDLGIEEGKAGIQKFIDQSTKLLYLLNNLDSDTIITSKIDGAPAIFFGDDDNGNFFVSTKSGFNVNPKLNHSEEEARENHKGDLGEIMASAYRNLSKAYDNSGLVYQGDLLFSLPQDKKIAKIDGLSYIIFKPNTITYAVPVDNSSDSYKRIYNSELGVVVHNRLRLIRTENNGYKTEFIDKKFDSIIESGIENNVFIESSDINSIDINMNPEIEGDIAKNTVTINKLLNKISDNFNKKYIESPLVGLLKNYINSQVRGEKTGIFGAVDKGEPFDSDKFVNGFINYIDGKYQKEIDKKVTPAGKKKYEDERQKLKDLILSYTTDFSKLIESFYYMYKIKNDFLNILKGLGQKLGKSYIHNEDEWNLLDSGEGFVIYSGDNQVKIVDRMAFSRMNMLLGKFKKQDTKVTEDYVYFDGDEFILKDSKAYDERNKIISSHDLIDSAVSLHTNTNLKTIDNLVDEISKYKKYELKDLPTNGLTFSVKETDFDKEKVSEYAQASKESNNNFPPVIVDPDHMRIIDGNHRVKGLIEIGQQTVPAYVGIKNDEPKGDKDIYNKEDDIKYENVGTGSFMGTSGEPGSGYAGGGAIMPGKNIDLSKKTSWDKYKKRKPRKFKAIVSPTKYGTFRDKSADNTATKITNIMNSKNENKRVSSMIMKEQIPPNIARLIDDEYHELIKNNFTSTCAIDKLAKDYKVNRQEIIDIIGLNNVKEELNPEEEYKKMEEQDTVEIAIFPGKFKYPHRGHWKMIELASKENDLVYVVISPKEVDGITAQMSKEIFDIYKKYLAKDNVIIEVAEISPVKSVYDFIESINKMGGKNKFILNTYASTEDKSRYENFINKKDKYTYNFVSVNILDLPRFDEIRATNNRIALQNEDWDKVSQSLPQELSKEDKEKVLNILRGK